MCLSSLSGNIAVYAYLISILTISMVKDVSGIEISPMVTALSIDSSPNYQQFVVKNNSNVTLPVEIDINRIQFNAMADGASYQVIPETSSDLLVFPPAIILAPGAVQSVRVQWLREERLVESQSYFIRFSQPQLQTETAKKSGVKIFVHFNAAVHVSARDLEPILVINESSIAQKVPVNEIGQASDSAVLHFSIENEGSKYANLSDYRLDITQVDGTEIQIQGEVLIKDQINTFFPPNAKRNMSIKLKRPLLAGFSLAVTPIGR
ncbi:MAG: P pilus assembly chaperone PapD [Oceanospirillaceae bacterium]|jgi:P pilus assembly chaperone PapD